MTSIAVCTKRMEIAADRKTTGSYAFETSKIFRLNDGSIFADAGSAGYTEVFAAWFHAGEDQEKYPSILNDTEFVRLTPDGEIWYYPCKGSKLLIEETQFSIGSGCDLVLAAMAFGSTPVEAVEYAEKRNNGTGLGVDVMSPEAPPDPDALKARIRELEKQLTQTTK